ncbi:RNA-binding region-containing protein 3-like [Hetaerina americana]|uniref:RNA-binding region-containing protein 3-like n=1 Tax=Hetaerina americana TaxID=62018 RepID=UPI003A7F1401
MQGSDTLVIRHLSNTLTDVEKEEFMKHFGAVKVKCISSQYKKYNLVFAKFSSCTAAKIALQRLHQVEVLGTPLTVEFTLKNENFEDPQEKFSVDKEKSLLKKKHKDFVVKLNSWHHSLQPTRPPPYHLRYEYPPANIGVLTNICRSIAVVPKLYTQVLHLMNRMNLPCPFGPLLPEPELFVVTKLEEEEETLGNTEPRKEEATESEESEIEEGEERQPLGGIIPILPAKRGARQGKPKAKKRRVFAPTQAVGPSSRVPMLPEEMFERDVPMASQPKKIELNIAVQPKTLQGEEGSPGEGETLPGFGVLPPTKKTNVGEEAEGQDEASDITRGAITLRELRSNRISTKDQKVLPVFKGYQVGAPSCRLYVKNVAKQVEPKDLHYIYSCFLDEKDEEQVKMFDVRLMQEGRMKGQAFITLPSTTQAKTALSETNGYILKGKPLVVQFARSAKPK